VDLVKNGEGLTVVNEVPLEDYLVGVLRAEIGDKWPPEALRPSSGIGPADPASTVIQTAPPGPWRTWVAACRGGRNPRK
jgi:Stage II sporulation protein